MTEKKVCPGCLVEKCMEHFSISNVKGTIDDIVIPDTPEFKKLEIIAAGTAASLTIVTTAPSGITTTQTGPTFDTTGMNPQELYNYIAGAYSQLLIAYNIYIGNTFLVFVPNPGYTIVSILASSERVLLNLIFKENA